MSTNNTCRKCGCQDQALTTPIVYPTPAPCPTPEPCSEAFDSQCVYYTGDNIMCDGDIVVSKNDTIETALNDIVDYFCNFTPTPSVLKVGFIYDPLVPLQLRSSVLNGTAPYTYQWSISQNLFMGHSFATSTTLNTVTFTTTTDAIRTVNGDGLFQSLIELKVTDVNGAYGSAYYTFSTVAVG